MSPTRRRKLLVLAGLLAVLALLPFVLSGFWVRLLTNIFMFAALASAINIIAGFAGYVAFGNYVFFGAGAYTLAVLMNKAKFDFLPAFLAAGLAAVLLAVVFGLLLLRLKGHYFALGSIGAAGATKQLVDLWSDLTGGTQGMSVPSIKGSPYFVNTVFYFFMLALLVAVVATAWRLSTNRLGYALKAIKADEEAASVMGIDTTRYKIIAWCLSALFTGLAGAIYALWFNYIEPAAVFDIMWVVKMFVMLLIGGMGTVFGPVLGAVLLESVSELVWANFMSLHLGLLGAIIILAVLFMPNGLANLVNEAKFPGLAGLFARRKEGRK